MFSPKKLLPPSSFRLFFHQPSIFAFHVNNYSTPLDSSSMLRLHNRFHYDENSHISKNLSLQEQMLSAEKKVFESLRPQFQKYTDFYYKRSISRRDPRNRELPERYGEYEYFSKFAKLAETNDYEIVFRTNLKTSAQEMVLDLKEIPFVTRTYWKTAKLAKMSISEDHRFIAFIVDLRNNENYIMGIKDTRLNKFLNIRIFDCSNVVFSKENQGFFFVKYDEKMRSNQVFVSSFEKNAQEELIFEEKDEQFYVDIAKSKDRRYLFITSSSKQISEVYAISLEEDSKKMIKLIGRENKARATALHSEENFYLLTDIDKVFDYKIMILSDSEAKKNKKEFSFQDYYLPKPGERLKEIDLFKKYMVLYLEKDGLSYMTVIDLLTKSTHNIDIQENLASISPGLNENYESETLRFHVDTPLFYNQVYEYDFLRKTVKILEKFRMEGAVFNKNNIKSERVYALSKDGEEIPLTLIYEKTLEKNRKNKVLLHGYGSYGIPLDISFNIVYLSALENHWVLAFAHVRGGNEKGWKWHESATKEKKINSFNDFLCCAEFLVAQGYTHPSLLCAYGASAGGLLVAAAVNMRPNLFKAVVLTVPFLDILSCLCDKNLPLTVSDYEEFGNPLENARIFDCIRSYSPYENIQNQEYPFVYLCMGEQDFRIPNWSILKFIKRFRERVKKPQLVQEICEKNILLNPLSGGHHGENSSAEGIRQKSTFLGLLDFIITEKSNDLKIH